MRKKRSHRKRPCEALLVTSENFWDRAKKKKLVRVGFLKCNTNWLDFLTAEKASFFGAKPLKIITKGL